VSYNIISGNTTNAQKFIRSVIIHPNDPCPCDSEKKLKNCCGNVLSYFKFKCLGLETTLKPIIFRVSSLSEKNTSDSN
jgi:hypothetical protein